jgi:hypothetical protein
VAGGALRIRRLVGVWELRLGFANCE